MKRWLQDTRTEWIIIVLVALLFVISFALLDPACGALGEVWNSAFRRAPPAVVAGSLRTVPIRAIPRSRVYARG